MKNLAKVALTLIAGCATTAATAAELSTLPSGSAFKNGTVTSVEPPCWWTGMAADTLQLLINGPGIARASASIDYPGVAIVDQPELDSPNYKILYLTIGKQTRPGTMKIELSAPGKKKTAIEYPLLARDRDPKDYKGFSAADVLYLVMPDRFAWDLPSKPAKGAKEKPLQYNPAPDRADPNARHGGNINGIRRHLDYIDSLGVTALWVCPVLENDMPGGSYHGYATTDYYRIDPRFGTNADWQALVKEAHDKGLKVVMDMIFNHTGSNHPWMKDAPTADWYNHRDGKTLTNFRLTTVHDPYASDYDKDHTVNGWFVPDMPDLNQRNPHVMKYLTQNSIWWIESSKIDGIRMDTYPYADMKGMASWGRDVMREYPEFNIVGECWYANEAGSAFWQKGSKINPEETHLPTVMDFWMILNGRKAFSEQTDPWHGLNAVYDHLSNDFLFPDPQKILTFIDNHDTDRFLASMPKNSEELGSWKQALAFILTTRGIPQIYYGTELLMNGSKEGSDGYVRRDFPGGFPSDDFNAFLPGGLEGVQKEAWDYLSNLLRWRRGDANEVIAKGSLKHFMPQNGIYAYQRRLGDKEVTVLMNGNDSELTVTMERTLEALPYGSRHHDAVTGRDVTIEKEMTFAPRQVMVLTKL